MLTPRSKTIALVLAGAVFGAGASVAVGACGEDRGGVEVEGGGTTGSSGATQPSGTPTQP